MATDTVTTALRIDKLNRASARRIIEPDVEIPGEVGPGQVLPIELLSIADLGLDLTPEQRIRLSREELASITEAGLRFEAVLMSGFARQIVMAPDLTDPRIVYALHEIGEETRHSRLFSRMLAGLGATAKNPMRNKVIDRFNNLSLGQITGRPALLSVLVLGGEEIPDLFQKKAMEHPDTDPFIREVNKYHRLEEARHLAYARATLPEHWVESTWRDRFAVKFVAPSLIAGMFDLLVHPGVYRSIGLPGWKTWNAARKSPTRVALRQEATRPVLQACIDAGVLKRGRLSRGWQRLCGVDRQGHALPA